MAPATQAVQTFGKKKTATAVAHAKEGRGLIHINGSPITLLRPEILRFKVYEPVLVAGEDAFSAIDIRLRVKGGGHTSQVYAIRQAIAKAVVAYYAKYFDAASALELKKKLVAYDRTLLIADPRRAEPKKFGGHGARARRQKSASMSEPQASGRVFVDSAGHPLRVFVEAAELEYRPTVIRTLKNNGAQIRHSPQEASVIIVDPETPSGAQFTQDWGSEPGKVVLDVAWVQKSVERRKALLGDENWGGYCTHTPNESASLQNPLPTPRETPPDAPTNQAHAGMQNQQPYHLPDGSQFSSGNIPNAFPYPQPHVIPQLPGGLPNGVHVPMASMQANPNAQVTLPAHLVAQLVGLVSQQGLNPASLGIGQMGSQMPMNMMQGPAMSQGYSQQGMPFMSQPSMFAQQPFPMSQQAPSYSGQPQMMNPPPIQYQHPTFATPDTNASISQMRGQSGMSDAMGGSPMEGLRSPSSKRKSASVDRPLSSSSARYPSLARTENERFAKYRRTSYPPDEPPLPYADTSPISNQTRRDVSRAHSKQLFTKQDGEPCKFFVQIDIRPRTKIADAIKKNGGRLVPDIADADYVILGAPSTRTFEERLKQAISYDKQAVRPQWVFECVEQNTIVDLDDFAFEGMKVEKKRGRPGATGKRLIVTGPGAPKPNAGKSDGFFLQDEDYVMDDDDDESDEEEEEEEEEEEGASGSPKTKSQVKAKEKAKGTTNKAPKTKNKKKAEKSRAAASQNEGSSRGPVQQRTASSKAFWRPSPPPPTRVVEHYRGKNLYTKEDLDYVDEYVPILFFRDPEMTLHAVSEKLHAKVRMWWSSSLCILLTFARQMPHHTPKSWSTFISHATRREKVEKMRRQAQIARRKASASGQETSQRIDPTAVPHAGPANQNPPTHVAPEDYDPFTILAKFFAGGGADNLADAEVWRVLSQQHPEMSAEAWEAYWIKHNEAISVAVAELSGVQGDPEGGTNAPTQTGDGQGAVKTEPE
ncbi:hypothetical protein BN946_scf184911.g115 [Trametes cinnabarina]|uniref:BRCT domain-containing protein n=1 Tax=Pycnoporus cinnabarinus TaxID=5643 RepID=A0A060SHC1_PYCCI|nr:hypothetical protein BN946_scf184911.g115 [Trametes cinnabarina]